MECRGLGANPGSRAKEGKQAGTDQTEILEHVPVHRTAGTDSPEIMVERVRLAEMADPVVQEATPDLSRIQFQVRQPVFITFRQGAETVAKAVTEAPEVPVAREEPVAAAGMALLATAFQVDLEMAEGAGEQGGGVRLDFVDICYFHDRIPRGMPRKPRIEIGGGLYHIITRGNNRRKIFRSHDDYLKFTGLVQQQKSKLPFYLYAYCLMPNHIQLLIEMQDDLVSRINVVTQTTTVGASVMLQSYGYDRVNRLLTASESVGGVTKWTQTFGYDVYGNRTSLVNTGPDSGWLPPASAPAVNAANNRFTSPFVYDPAGNVTTDNNGNIFGYDAENHQKSCTVAGLSTVSE
jgi:REP element-mobilizing transposase RayT